MKDKVNKKLEQLANKMLKQDEKNQKLKELELPSGSLDIFFND